MPQNEYIERWQKLHGKRLDHDERARKREAREGHKKSKDAQNLRGLRAKLMQEKRRVEKIQMKKKIRQFEERNVKTNNDKEPSEPLPAFLLDRNNPTNAKALSSAIKQKRNEKAARFAVPLPKVRGISGMCFWLVFPGFVVVNGTFQHHHQPPTLGPSLTL